MAVRKPAEKLETWRERWEALRHLPPLLGEVWQTNPSYAICSLLARLLLAVLPVMILYVAKLAVDEVVGLATGQPLAGGVLASETALWRYFGIEVGLAVLSDLTRRLQTLTDALLGEQFSNRMTLRLVRHAATLDLESFEDPVFQDKLERARRQTADRLTVLFLVASLLQQGLGLVVMSSAVIAFSPWFFLLLVGSLAPVFWSESYFAGLSYALLYRWTPERRRVDYLRLLGASYTTAKEVKLYGLSGYLTDRLKELLDKYYAESRKLAQKRAIFSSLWGLLPTAAYYASFGFILVETVTRRISVGDLIFLSRAFANARNLLGELFQSLSRVAEQALYVRDLYDFFEMRPRLEVKPGALVAPRVWKDGVRFEGVGFAYADGKTVLDGLSFTLPAGAKLALLGENGAGKTTIVKLMCRLYDPSVGRILLEGVDLREYDPESLRERIGVIFQDFLKYDLLARENVALGDTKVGENPERISQAAAMSYADSVVAQLPAGWETLLGRRFEGGVELSQGQWQKIALARAYLREAQLLILDEPTASLDARAEYEVFERLAKLTAGRSAVLISHRFSTVRMADEILVLDGGRVKERGTHAGLLAKRGQYAELFELQAKGYR